MVFEFKRQTFFRNMLWIPLLFSAGTYGGSTPAPCANCNGVWTDNFRYTWIVDTMSGGTITGTFRNNGADTCPSYTSSLSGSYSSTANPQFTIYAQSPSVPVGTLCGNGTTVPSFIGYSGNIQSGGCDTGSGTWNNGQGTGSFNWSKSCDSPTGETTYDSGYWGDSGLQAGAPEATKHLWLALVTADSDFSGRTVGEQPGVQGNDRCNSLAPDAGILPLQNVTGGNWYINSPGFGFNQWGYDGVGYSPDAVNAYRSRGVVPCGTTVYQTMVIYCNNLSYRNYQNNTLTASINDQVTIGSGRGGVSATRTWP